MLHVLNKTISFLLFQSNLKCILLNCTLVWLNLSGINIKKNKYIAKYLDPCQTSMNKLSVRFNTVLSRPLKVHHLAHTHDTNLLSLLAKWIQVKKMMKIYGSIHRIIKKLVRWTILEIFWNHILKHRGVFRTLSKV